MVDRSALRHAALVALAGVVLGALATTLTGDAAMGPGHGRPHVETTYVQAKVFLSTFNLVVFGALALEYAALYRRVPTPFTGSLLLFSLALLFYAGSASPLFHLTLGFRGGGGLGPFTFLPDAFAAIAGVVLVYQSRQ